MKRTIAWILALLMLTPMLSACSENASDGEETAPTASPGVTEEEVPDVTEDVETKVTRLMESVLGGVTDLDEITSQTREGRSRVACKFRWGTELGEASNDMRDLIERAKRRGDRNARIICVSWG